MSAMPVLGPSLAPDRHGRRSVRGADDPHQLLRDLDAAGWSGGRLAALRDDLYMYGWDVLRGMVRSRRIVAVKSGVPVTQLSITEWARLSEPAERDQVTLDVLARAVPKLINSMQSGQWNPDRSSLQSYFIGRCAREFKDVIRARRPKQLRLDKQQVGVANAYIEQLAARDDPAQQAVDRRFIAEIASASGVSSTTRAVMAQLAQGYTHREIGMHLGLTAKAVERHVSRLRGVAWGMRRLEEGV